MTAAALELLVEEDVQPKGVPWWIVLLVCLLILHAVPRHLRGKAVPEEAGDDARENGFKGFITALGHGGERNVSSTVHNPVWDDHITGQPTQEMSPSTQAGGNGDGAVLYAAIAHAEPEQPLDGNHVSPAALAAGDAGGVVLYAALEHHTGSRGQPVSAEAEAQERWGAAATLSGGSSTTPAGGRGAVLQLVGEPFIAETRVDDLFDPIDDVDNEGDLDC